MKSTLTYLIIWIVIALGAAYVSFVNFIHWHENTAGWWRRILAVVMGLLCVSAVIRVGNALHWWRFLYGPGQ